MNKVNAIKALNSIIKANNNNKGTNNPTKLYREYMTFNKIVSYYGMKDSDYFNDFNHDKTFVYSNHENTIISDSGLDLDEQIKKATSGNSEFAGCFLNAKVNRQLNNIGNDPNKLYIWRVAMHVVEPAKDSDIMPLVKKMKHYLMITELDNDFVTKSERQNTAKVGQFIDTALSLYFQATLESLHELGDLIEREPIQKAIRRMNDGDEFQGMERLVSAELQAIGMFLSDDDNYMDYIFPTVMGKLDGLFTDMAKLPNIDGKAIIHNQRFVNRHALS